MCQASYEESDAPKEVRFVALVARLVTTITLVVAIVITKINTITADNGYKITYSDYNSYSYMFYVAVLAFVYTLFQVPLAMYYLRRGKRLLKHYGFLQFDFYGDKITSLLLATAAGAAFGATMDLKKYWIDKESKYLNLYNMAYIAVGFLLIGFLGSGMSSVLSSYSLSRFTK